jgi:hypothetical protein
MEILIKLSLDFFNQSEDSRLVFEILAGLLSYDWLKEVKKVGISIAQA